MDHILRITCTQGLRFPKKYFYKLNISSIPEVKNYFKTQNNNMINKYRF